MARTAEVVTITSLNVWLEEAEKHFEQSKKANTIAASVKDIPEAHDMLMVSANMHSEQGFKCLRKIQVKIVNALTETTGNSMTSAKMLIDLADTMDLFPL